MILESMEPSLANEELVKDGIESVFATDAQERKKQDDRIEQLRKD